MISSYSKDLNQTGACLYSIVKDDIVSGHQNFSGVAPSSDYTHEHLFQLVHRLCLMYYG